MAPMNKVGANIPPTPPAWMVSPAAMDFIRARPSKSAMTIQGLWFCQGTKLWSSRAATSPCRAAVMLPKPSP